MKKYTFTLSILVVLLAFVISSCSQSGGGSSTDKVTLELKLEKGQEFKMVSETDQDISMKVMGFKNDMHQAMSFYTKFDVLGEKGEGYEMKVTYDRIKYKIESGMMGSLIDYDSEGDGESSDNPMMAAMDDGFDVMVGKSFNIVMSRQGKVESVSGLDELMSAMQEKSGGAEAQTMSADDLEKMMQNMIAIFPKTQVGVGDTWGSKTKLGGQYPMEMETDYKVEEIDANKVYLNVEAEITMDSEMELPDGVGSMNMGGEMEGSMEVDRKSGMVLSSNMTMDMKGNVKAGPIDTPIEIESTITIKPY